jgi:hypothetical protein
LVSSPKRNAMTGDQDRVYGSAVERSLRCVMGRVAASGAIVPTWVHRSLAASHHRRLRVVTNETGWAVSGA